MAHRPQRQFNKNLEVIKLSVTCNHLKQRNKPTGYEKSIEPPSEFSSGPAEKK